MKILYLKGYKSLLSQNQQVRIDFLGYIQYEALAKHIKPFLKNIKVKGCQKTNYFKTSSFQNTLEGLFI